MLFLSWRIKQPRISHNANCMQSEAKRIEGQVVYGRAGSCAGVRRADGLVGDLDVFELVLGNGTDGEGVFTDQQMRSKDGVSDVQTPIAKLKIAAPVTMFLTR